MNKAPYPRRSDNVHQNSISFANSVGQETDLRHWEGAEIFEAPVGRYEEDSFIVNQYGKSVVCADGVIGLQFADRVLDGKIPEAGQELLVTLIEQGKSPETGETYRATLELENSPYPEEMDDKWSYPILIKESPDGMDYGIYDFVVNHTGGDFAVVDGSSDSTDVKEEPIDSLVDLRDAC